MRWRGMLTAGLLLALGALVFVTCHDAGTPRSIPAPDTPDEALAESVHRERRRVQATEYAAPLPVEGDVPGAELQSDGPGAVETESLTGAAGFDVAFRRATGRVVGIDGAPVAGVHVALVSLLLDPPPGDDADFDVELASRPLGEDPSWWLGGGNCPGLRSSCRTGRDGTFVVEYVDGGPRVLTVGRGGDVLAVTADVADARPCEVTVAEPATALSGRVVEDASGKPVGLGVVSVRAHTVISRFAESVAESPVDENGRFAVTGVARGDVRVSWRPNGSDLWQPAVCRLRRGTEDTRELEIRVVSGRTVTGRVTDRVSGVGVGGASVGFEGFGDVEGYGNAEGRRVVYARPEPSCVTGPDGAYRLEGVVLDDMSFAPMTVTADGYAASRVMVGFPGPGAAAVGGDVTLERSASLSARVVGEDGRVAAGAFVLASSVRLVALQQTGEDGHGLVVTALVPDERTGNTGSDGRVRIDALAPGSAGNDLTVKIWVRGVLVTERTFAPLSPGEARELGDIALAATGSVTGTVTGVDGAVVKGATLVAAPSDPADPERRALTDAWFRQDGARTTTDGEGAFTLRGLAPGAWDLYVTADGLAPRLVPGVTVESASAPARRDVRLDAGRTFKGTVVFADGRPAPGVTVLFQRVGALRLGIMEQAETDSGGAFEIAGIAGDVRSLRIRVLVPDGFDSEADPEEREVDPAAGPVEFRLPASR